MTARELQGFVGTAPEAHYRHFRLTKRQTATATKPETCRVHHGLIALGLSSVLSAPLAATAAGLNDTGQTCYDATTTLVACTAANAGDAVPYPRQDGRYGRDAAAAAGALPKTGGGAAGFDFTALDADGNPTAPTAGATPHPCVYDHVTGLTWEVKTDDDGLRDKDWRYTWYSIDAATNGGNPGTANKPLVVCGSALTSCNTSNYIAAVNAVGLCGHQDWRLPRIQELQSIAHYGRSNPAIDTSYFPNTVAAGFWSGSTYAKNTAQAWDVFFTSSGVYTDVKNAGYLVRLVRGGPF